MKRLALTLLFAIAFALPARAMDLLMSTRIPGATVQGLANAVGYWIGADGTLTSNGVLLPDKARMNWAKYPLVKVYVSLAAQAGTVGMRMDVVETWPQKNSAGGVGLVNGYPPIVAATPFFGAVQTVNATTLFTFATTANVQMLNVDSRATIAQGGASTFATLLYQGGIVALQLFATTWSSTAGDIYIDVWGCHDDVGQRVIATGGN